MSRLLKFLLVLALLLAIPILVIGAWVAVRFSVHEQVVSAMPATEALDDNLKRTPIFLDERAGNRDMAIQLREANRIQIPMRVEHSMPLTLLKFGLLAMPFAILFAAALVWILVPRVRIGRRGSTYTDETTTLERIMQGLDKMERRTDNLEEILLREGEKVE